jgi:hypothetical protein
MATSSGVGINSLSPWRPRMTNGDPIGDVARQRGEGGVRGLPDSGQMEARKLNDRRAGDLAVRLGPEPAVGRSGKGLIWPAA